MFESWRSNVHILNLFTNQCYQPVHTVQHIRSAVNRLNDPIHLNMLHTANATAAALLRHHSPETKRFSFFRPIDAEYRETQQTHATIFQTMCVSKQKSMFLLRSFFESITHSVEPNRMQSCSSKTKESGSIFFALCFANQHLCTHDTFPDIPYAVKQFELIFPIFS